MFSANSSQVSNDKLFVEDVFSTWLYTGTGAAQTITNGIDLAGKGGLVWTKARSAANRHALVDTAMGGGFERDSASTAIDRNLAPANAFNATGYTINDSATSINSNGVTYASWTFRKAPKFFDVVTYTGNGVNGRLIPSSLATGPGTLGAIIVKRLDSASDWKVFHRRNGTPSINNLILNSTNAQQSSNNDTGFVYWENDGFLCYAGSTDISAVNASGGSYVAYLFAHDATSDGVIQCGSFTTDGSGNSADINLGWEPQWLLYKNVSSAENWQILDTMRNWSNTSGSLLYPNLSNAEASAWTTGYAPIYATGFKQTGLAASKTYIYIAIRRGPMRTPTLGTSVFAVDISNATGSATSPEFVSNFPVDMYFLGNRANSGGGDKWYWMDRLRGNVSLNSTTTAAESAFSVAGFAFNTGVFNTAITSDYYATMFRRAPSFMDVVCYTGTGVARTVSHNLGVAPELIIIKNRGASTAWLVYCAQLASPNDKYLFFNPDGASTNVGTWKTPTSTTFGMDISFSEINASGNNYVAYLFASAPGVSKVGSYTGNGSSQTINCAFAAGARFVMIKRTDNTGDWYVWDTARGIVAGNDPHLSLNTTAAEVTSNDTVDTDSSGFVVNQVAATNVNVSSATYIYLAIA